MNRAAGQPQAVVVGGAVGLGREITQALRDRGAWVTVAGALPSRADADAVFAAATAHGPLRHVVHAYVEPAALRPHPLAGYDDETWDRYCEAAVRGLLFCLQAAHLHLPADGGHVVVVCPVPAGSQGAGRAALAATGSAQRVLAVSAGRRWAARHIAVNAVTVDPATFAGDPGDAGGGRVRDVAALVAVLATGGHGSLSGATVPVPPPGGPVTG